MAKKTQSAENQVTKSALEMEMEKIEKDYGKGTIVSAKTHDSNCEVISTGSISLDYATGVWGLPRSKVVEIIGWESSGKSTITLQTLASAQARGCKALLIDGENSFDANYAKALGVDVDSLLIQQLDKEGGEKCYNVAERLMRTKEIGIVVIDSQTSLLPKKVLEGAVGESAIGLHARLMSQCVPKLVNAAQYGNCLVIFISQFREKIGVMFGSPETTNGGNALKFYSHMRIEVRKSVLREEGTAYANKTKCKIIKNKLAIPFKEAEFNIIYGEGTDRVGEVISLGVEHGVIGQGGAWFTYGDFKFQGEDALRQALVDNESFGREVEEKVIKILNGEENTIEESVRQEEGTVQESNGSQEAQGSEAK